MNGIGEKAHYWISAAAICARRVLHRPGWESMPQFSDLISYRKITKLVPLLASYKLDSFAVIASHAKEKGYTSLKTYYTFLANNQDERDFLSTNVTWLGSHFFRGQDWDFLDKTCLSTFSDKGSVRVWCAGCSSGKEVYSLIMMLADHVALDAIDVLASDYNDELLERCEKGEYTAKLLKEIPERYHRHLEVQDDRFTIKKELRDRVHTQNINLLSDDYPAPFDIILCRNVIKFFTAKARVAVKGKLIESLAPNGYLFVSMDDNHYDLELVDAPEDKGLVRLEGRGVYKKVGSLISG